MSVRFAVAIFHHLNLMHITLYQSHGVDPKQWDCIEYAIAKYMQCLLRLNSQNITSSWIH